MILPEGRPYKTRKKAARAAGPEKPFFGFPGLRQRSPSDYFSAR